MQSSKRCYNKRCNLRLGVVDVCCQKCTFETSFCPRHMNRFISTQNIVQVISISTNQSSVPRANDFHANCSPHLQDYLVSIYEVSSLQNRDVLHSQILGGLLRVIYGALIHYVPCECSLLKTFLMNEPNQLPPRF